MSVDWLSLGVVSLVFFAVGIVADSIGRPGLSERGKRSLLLAYSYKNALALARACKADGTGKAGSSKPTATEKSCQVDPETEDGKK